MRRVLHVAVAICIFISLLITGFHVLEQREKNQLHAGTIGAPDFKWLFNSNSTTYNSYRMKPDVGILTSKQFTITSEVISKAHLQSRGGSKYLFIPPNYRDITNHHWKLFRSKDSCSYDFCKSTGSEVE